MNPELTLTLDEAVEEVLALLTGLDLSYDPRSDRYGTITRMINRALRNNALEHEWSYYASTAEVGTAVYGEQDVLLPSTVRPRIINDDAVRLVDEHDHPVVWAYFLPRDALHKYAARSGLWCSVIRNTLSFSRVFNTVEEGLRIFVPVMREPVMFRLPVQPEDPNEPLLPVPAEVRQQQVDFFYPDIIIARAAWLYAQTDPVMQPRVQTLEAQYKDLMYQVIERDDRNTDTPLQNEFILPIQNGLNEDSFELHRHPHSSVE